MFMGNVIERQFAYKQGENQSDHKTVNEIPENEKLAQKRSQKLTLVKKETEQSSKRKDRSSYTLEDFESEFAGHPEWQNANTSSIQRFPGGPGFYGALRQYAIKESAGDRGKQREIIQKIFEPKLADRSNYTLDDFVTEFNNHPEWQNATTHSIRKFLGGGSFYQALTNYAKIESAGDKDKQREIIQKIFKPKLADRSNYTIEDFVAEFAKHPEWQEVNVHSIREFPGGSSFYESLRQYAIKESAGDKDKQKEIIQKIFESNRVYRADYTLEDFISEFNNHPEWQGVNASSIRELPGGGSFYQALQKYATKESAGDRGKQREIIQKIFEPKQTDRSNYTIEDFMSELANHPEWQNPSDKKARNERLSFYASLRRYNKRKSAGDRGKQREIIQKIFEPKLADRSNYTLDDFVTEFNNHPEWQNATTHSIRKFLGGSSFYQAFQKYAIKESAGDRDKQREIIQKIFEPKLIDRSNYTLDDFVTEFNNHPEWQGLSTSEMQSEKRSGGNAFYQAFQKYAIRESAGDRDKQREIIQKIFEPKLADRSGYVLEDFKAEYATHPEWHGKTISEMHAEGKGSSARSFYKALAGYARRTSNGDEVLRKKIIEEALNQRRKSRFDTTRAEIAVASGSILQYSVECILKLINQKNLAVEKIFAGGRRPDLVYETDNNKIIFDIKLQTTTGSIEKDIRHYLEIFKKEYKQGGNIIFLCLNGPNVQNRDIETKNGIVKIRYYHLLNFLTRLSDNKRNLFLLNFLNARPANDRTGLSDDTITKIKEIKESLEKLREKILSENYPANNQDMKIESTRYKGIRSNLFELARNKNIEDIMNTDFKRVLDFG